MPDMLPNPRVLLNLGPLGGSVKTGVYRVSENIALGMARRLGNRASFHILSDLGGSVGYFTSKLKSQGSTLRLSALSGSLVPLSRALSSFVHTSPENRSIFRRARRKAAHVAGRAIDRLSTAIPPEALDSTDIYHSPFDPIPNEIKARGSIRRFITIYDLIAVTNPEYFDEHTVSRVKRIISSLDGEDHTLCISAYTRKLLLEHSDCSPERSFVVPLAASSDFHPETDPEINGRILTKYGIPGSGFILSLCTLEIRKNLDALISAYAELRRTGAIPGGTKLVLVGGSGWKTSKLEKALLSASEFSKDILMPGFVPDGDLAAIYSSAKVFVYMSLLEGFGLPPLEAMQCGTPVITSNTSSLPEVVGDAGVMLEPHDTAGLCRAISRFYSDDSYHRSVSARCLKRSALFNWDHHIDQTIAAYRVAMGNIR